MFRRSSSAVAPRGGGLRRIALIGAALLVLAFTTLVVLARVYDAEVKVKLIGTLNGYLTTPVTVSSMDLTLIERFPQASIHLRDVLALEPGRGSDTLVYAGDLYLEFSLLGMLRGIYTVDEVHGRRVVVHPGLDSLGHENWIIWKADTISTSKAFSLDRVSLNDLLVRYHDDRSKLEVLVVSERLDLGGDFGEGGSRMKLKGHARLHHWSDEEGVVLSDRLAGLKLDLSFGGADGAFRITKGEVVSGNTALAVTMSVIPGEDGDLLDLRANGLGLGLAGAVQLLPDGIKRGLDPYGMDGEVDLALTYKGPIDTGPLLAIGMKVRNGRMQERKSGVQFKAINGECAIELTPKGDLSRLLVKGFTAQAPGGTLSGSWDMKGSTNAPLKADLKCDIALADLLRFAQVDTLELVAGRLVINAHMEGRVRDVAQLKAADLRELRITGTAQMKDATLKMKGIRHVVSGLNADLALNGNDADVRALTCTVQGNAMTLNGELRNLMPYLLFTDQPLMIAASGSSPRIDLAALLRDGTHPVPADDAYAVKLPALIQLELKARVDELVFEEFHATDINGTITLKDRVLRASPVMFHTASGAVLGSLAIDTRGESAYPFTVDATIKGIDVKQVFSEFQEFGQSFITSRHLSGTADAQVAFAAPLSPALKLDLDHLHCTVDIAIANGAITQHQPLLDVATYVKDNKLIAPWVNVDELRDRLADVRFDRLENRIEIRDRQVIVPAMTVHNNALDIELSGIHGFDDQIDHHLNFRLSDLLKKNEPDDEFGPVVDDGTGLRIFLHMYGPATAPQFETDGAMAAQRRRQEIKEQTAELRSILHNELNPFANKDPQQQSTTPPPLFEVDWSEGDSTQQAPPAKTKKKGIGRAPAAGDKPKVVIEVVE